MDTPPLAHAACVDADSDGLSQRDTHPHRNFDKTCLGHRPQRNREFDDATHRLPDPDPSTDGNAFCQRHTDTKSDHNQASIPHTTANPID